MKRILRSPAEWLTAIGTVVTLIAALTFLWPISGWREALRIVGLAVFFSGVVIAIREIREVQADLRTEVGAWRSSMQRVVGDLGQSLDLVRDVIRSSAHAPHIVAGRQALRKLAFEVVHDRARGLKNLAESGTQLNIEEHHFINSFLRNLADSLDKGSVWCGVTLLTEGWLEHASEPGYTDFVRLMQRRSKDGELLTLRVYCYSEPSELEQLADHLRDESKSGIVVKTLDLRVAHFNPEDLTVVWPSLNREQLETVRKAEEPAGWLLERGYRPLCSLQFATSAGRLLKSLHINGAEADITILRRQLFERAWRAASVWRE